MAATRAMPERGKRAKTWFCSKFASCNDQRDGEKTNIASDCFMYSGYEFTNDRY